MWQLLLLPDPGSAAGFLLKGSFSFFIVTKCLLIGGHLVFGVFSLLLHCLEVTVVVVWRYVNKIKFNCWSILFHQITSSSAKTPSNKLKLSLGLWLINKLGWKIAANSPPRCGLQGFWQYTWGFIHFNMLWPGLCKAELINMLINYHLLTWGEM